MVLIEGTASPCMYLAHGEQRVVPLTRRVQALIDGGYVRVIERQTVELGRRRADG